MMRYLDIYLTNARVALMAELQYRAASLLWMAGMLTEPVVYLLVWSLVASQQGGSVAGFTGGDFAAYYIIWTLVRNMNIALTPYAFENRVRKGELSPELMRPMHPFHYDLSFFFGWKVNMMILWLPVAVVLWVVFQPTLNPTWWQVIAFCIAVVTGFLTRFILLWILGLATFWITRVSALFEFYFMLELFFSGRLVPMALMPGWVQQAAAWMPYQWSFGFPIELLMGRLTVDQTLYGFAMQGLWAGTGAIVLAILWRFAIREYSAAGA